MGDRYEVLSDAATPIVILGEKTIGVTLKNCPQLDACEDYRIELVTPFATIAKRVRLASYHPPYAVFAPLE